MFNNVYSNQIEQRIFERLEPSVNAIGYTIVRLRFSRGKHKGDIQIMVEGVDGKGATIGDCENISKHVSLILEVYDELLNCKSYNLEVSSPGINRPLTRIEDFKKYVGHEVKIRTWRKISNNADGDEGGSASFNGFLSNVNGDISIIIKVNNLRNNQEIEINFDNIKEANLEYDIAKILKESKKKFT